MEFEDLEINVSKEFIGVKGRFEVKRGKIVFDQMQDVELDTPSNLIGFKGNFVVMEDRIVFKVNVMESLPKELRGITERFLIKKEGKFFEPFKELTLNNLRLAATYGIASEVKRLLDRGVIPTKNIIKLAVENGHLEIVELLLDRKVPIDEKAIEWTLRNH
uniref:Ankyrin repeat protein n=1 Tax=Pithovirus LCDPAC01 TaxID=2506600 RepID=A0A481YP08_9VIRU|nr:MAG: ankyrin repeat protein [Pithovirus LCDPAC01]